MDGGATPDQSSAVLRTSIRELALLGEDLALDFDVTVEVRASADTPPARHHTRPGFRLFLDDIALQSRPANDSLASGVAETLHLHAPVLVGEAVAQHLWREWDGVGDAPVDWQMLLQRLVRMRVRPDRLAAVPAEWDNLSSDGVFEEALNEAARAVNVYVHPSRRGDVEPAFPRGAEGAAATMIDGLFYELGIHVGECRIVDDVGLDPGVFRVSINDIRSPPMHLIGSDERLVNDTVDRLTLLNIRGEEAVNPADGSEWAVIPSEHASIAEQSGLTLWNPGEYVVLGLSARLRQAAPALLTADVLRFLLDKLRGSSPALVAHVEETIGVTRLGSILRCLLDEEINVRNLREIIDNFDLVAPLPVQPIPLATHIVFSGTYAAFQSVSPPPQNGEDSEDRMTAEGLRMVMKRYISYKYTRGGNTLVVYLLEPTIESRLRDAGHWFPGEVDEFLSAVREEVGSLPPTAQKPVILTTEEIRRTTRELVAAEFPYLAVLSYQELSPDMNIQPIARITSDDWPYSTTALLELAYNFQPEAIVEPGLRVMGDAPEALHQVAELLDAKRGEILERLVSTLVRLQRTMPQPLAEALASPFLDAYLELLVADRSDSYSACLQQILPLLAKRRITPSDLLRLPFAISQQVRLTLAEVMVETGEGVAALNAHLDRVDGTAEQILQLTVDQAFRSRFQETTQ